ncbi:MAG: methionyl-tRNA formyltransferase [bacterium]|nr:methionyl-tRNA formyltransferase [bacterium]
MKNIVEKILKKFNKNNKKLRVIFMGTPAVSVPFLEYLIENVNVVAVFTAADLPAGRKLKMRASAVKIAAGSYSLKIFQPNSLKSVNIVKQVERLKPDLIITVAYGHKVPDNIIEIPRYKTINIHFSLLPKYRGAAPVNWVIVNGDKKTGVTCFYLSSRMDAGDIIDAKEIEIKDSDNAETLLQKLSVLGVDVLKDSLLKIKDPNFKPLSQDENQVTDAPKLKKKNGVIKWNQTSVEVYNKIRGFYPWPSSFTYLDTADSLKIVKLFSPKIKYVEEEGNVPGEVLGISKKKGILVKCGHGAIWIKDVQLEGHKIVSGYEFHLGRRINQGDIFE